MDVAYFVFGVLFCHFEGFIEFVSVTQVFDHCVNEVHLQKHLHSCLWTQVLSPMFR